MEIYIVKLGDTLYQIAERFGVSAQRIAYDNNIWQEELVVGQALLIAQAEITYTVQEGDTLQGIADMFSITEKQLLQNNSFLLNEAFLIPGRQLVIRYAGERRGRVPVSGYAYSFIQESILEESCLYIDELLPFSYGYNPDGSLLIMQDEHLIEIARRFGVKNRLVITPLDRNERFNNQLVVRLLSDEQVQDTLLDNILEEMIQKGYTALDIDFEFIPGEYRYEYVEFIRKAKERLGEYELSVAVPPKVSDDQPGLLYEGIDYEAIGRIADHVFLMTYEWGYKYGPPMAVALYNGVRRVLDYAVSVIPTQKLEMGIPNYAYDWELPFERGVTVAETIGNAQAVRRAYLNGTEILYDEESQAPYYYYQQDGREHVVWFEDVRSIRVKYDLIAEYGLYGARYWNLMREFRQNWLYVNLM